MTRSSSKPSDRLSGERVCVIAHYCEHTTYLMSTGDYFRVLVDESGVQEVLDKLDALSHSEQLVTAASTYAVVREGKV